MPDSARYLVALAVIAGGKYLLVTQSGIGKLELLGLTLIKDKEEASQICQLVRELGLDGNVLETLLLPKLFIPELSAKPLMVVVQLVYLPKVKQLAIPNSRFEKMEKLAKAKEASHIVQAVVRWFVERESKIKHQ